MNELDQFVKHELRVKYYARYTDDFVIVSKDLAYLEALIPQISKFLSERLALSLHPNKVSIRKYRQGIDFLGYVVLPGRIVMRSKTRKRIYRKLREQTRRFKMGAASEDTLSSSFHSYLGVLSHADAHEIEEDLRSQFGYWMSE